MMAIAPLIRTKLHRPRVPPDLVERPRLVEMLNQGDERKLTLVSAPAGYGKSTAVSAWVETLAFPAAWLSLDEYDDDLATFSAYLAAAVSMPYSDACQSLAALLQAPMLPPPHRLADAFLVDLEALPGPLALALDDYHTLQSPSIHAFMQRVVHRLPASIQLVIITRQDPPLDLPRLRARRQVLEIDEGDLAFTAEEASTLLSRLSGEPISNEIVTLLSERTEGWPVGLTMAGISLRESRDPGAFAHHFAQTRHHLLTEYLLSEVLNELTTAERAATLQVAVVERFSADLCEAIVQLPGSVPFDGEAFIRKLMGGNLFIISLDNAGVWYRFHHLFRDLLRRRLLRTYTDEAIAQMHVRASAWFANKGLIDEAIEHALAAGDMIGAAELVEQHRSELLEADQWLVLEKRLDRLPNEIKQQRPNLLLAQAWIEHYRFKMWDITQIVETVATLLDSNKTDRAIQGEMNAIWGILWYWQGQAERSLMFLKRALELLPESYYQARGEAGFYWGLVRQMSGQQERGIRELTDMIRHDSTPTGRWRIRLVASLAAIHLLSGDLTGAEQAYRRMQAAARRNHDAYLEVMATYWLGIIHYCWDDLENAAQYLEQAIARRYVLQVRVAIDSLAALSLTHQARGHLEKTEETLELLLEFALETRGFVHEDTARSCQAHLDLLEGKLQSAALWRKTADMATDVGSMVAWLEIPRITQCRVLIAEGTTASLEEAEAKLRKYIRENEALYNTFQLIQLLPLQAQLQQKQGRTEEALATLRQAVMLAEPGGWIRPFAEGKAELWPLLRTLLDQGVAPDYVSRILMSASAPQSSRVRAGSAAISFPDITNREMDVLELLARRLTNKEIAVQLHISPRTVKKHTINIYQKLHVENRRQAVVRARELGILPAGVER